MGALLSEMQNPSENDIRLANESSRRLATIIPSLVDEAEVHMSGDEDAIKLPILAIHLLMDILENMSKGQPVSIIPSHAELTTQEAANILNVSRPYLVGLLDTGKIEHRKIGKHRRVKYEDLMKYKRDEDSAREKALEELARISQEDGMGY